MHVPADSKSRAPARRRLKGDTRLSLHHQACISVHSLPGGCERCATSCPAGALTVHGDGPVLRAECLGCGRCAEACPTGALSAAGFDAALPDGNAALSIECWKVSPELCAPNALRVPCVAGIGMDMLLAWFQRRQGRPIEVVDRGWCAGCAAGRGGNPAQALVTAARDLLLACGWPESSVPIVMHRALPLSAMPDRIPLPASQLATSRRGFFRSLLADVADSVPPAATVDRAALLRSPQSCALPKRARLIATAARLAEARGAPLPGDIFPRAIVSDSCDHAGACAALCPTRALTTYDSGDSAGLMFDAQRCVVCGICVRACRQQALFIDPDSPAAPAAPIVLTRFPLRRCSTCLRKFAAAGERRLCGECRRSRQMWQQLFHGPASETAIKRENSTS